MPVKKVYSLYKEAYSGLPKEAWLLALVVFIFACPQNCPLKGKSLKKIISLGVLFFGTGFAFALAVTVGPSIGAVIYDSLGPNFLWFGCGGMGILLFLGFTPLKEKGS